MQYTLMNKNIPLAEVEFSDRGYITAIKNIITAEAFPVGVLDRKGNMGITLLQLNDWWKSRVIPASRQDLAFLLNEYGFDTAAELSVRSLGLSLSDQYWLRPDTDLTWDNVNFFTNTFSEDLGEAFFSRGSSKPDINPFSPDASSNGWLKKKWKIIDGERYLAKGGSGPFFQEPYNEVIASQIMKLLDITHVEYSLIMEGGNPLCLCKNFVTPDTELVPAVQVRNIIKKSNNDSELSHFLRCADALEIPGVARYIDELLSIDFLIENTDRHYGNFGFLRDVNTLRFLGPAPIFDNGTSLWNSSVGFEIGSWQPCRPFKATHKEQIKLLKSCVVDRIELVNVVCLVESVFAKLPASPYLEQERVERIIKAIGGRVTALEYQLNKIY